MNSRRSASVGALPREKKHFVSRNESGSGVSLDVRCACQYFQCDSLLPDRINPVDSRPSSKLEFHGELGSINEQIQNVSELNQFHPMNLDVGMHVEELSTRSFNVAGPATHMEVDRFSMRSVGGQRSWDQAAPPVDLTFVEKYPELEETARSRGLVVSSISDADVAGNSTFLAGTRRRQMSVGGMSTRSGGMRDADTLSMRSGTSLRRISRSPSKADLFVADINIPSARNERRDQRSASASRRTSNVDLSHFASHQTAPTAPMHVAPIVMTPGPLRQQQMAPQLNLIAPTPSPAMADVRPDFSRAVTPQRSSSPGAQDYRIAKPPVSTDYMRPDENKENLPFHRELGEVLPQHRPIDVTRYGPEVHEPTTPEEPVDMKTWNLSPKLSSRAASPVRAPSPAPKSDPLQQRVAELEAKTASSNIVDIRDNIKVQTTRPPSPSDIRQPSLHLGEETQIDIKSSVPMVDIDSLVREEEEKAARANRLKQMPRQQSPPPPKRQLSPPPMRQQSPTPAQQMDTLQLPRGRSRANDTPSPTQSQLKRQHTPERLPSPDRSKKSLPPVQRLQPQAIEMHTVTINGAIPLQEASPEAKSYASRFKSMFSVKSNETQREASPKRQKSPSPSVKRDKSPSPVPTKLLSMFSKTKPSAIEMMSSSNAVITKRPEAEPMSVKVTETFSLKVDEMDQYGSRPAKPPPQPQLSHTATPSQTVFSSQEDFRGSDRISVNMSEAFAPVVIPSGNSAIFMAGNRTLYSSEIDMHSPFHSSSLEPSMGRGSHFNIPKGALISVPINIGSSGNIPQTAAPSASINRMPPRSPSEQRVMPSQLDRQASFMDGRTQSQDRARIAGSHEDLYSSRMTKTVSFNFDERKSRLSEFENSAMPQQQKDQRDFLERTYYSRDHEYEPIGAPSTEEAPSFISKESSPVPNRQPFNESKLSMEVETIRDEMKEAEELQKDLEDRYFSSEPTTPRTESRMSYEIHTSQVDSSALEELPLKPENRKKGFMASAQDRTRKMQAGFKNQAGKLKTKLRSPAKKPPSGSPKAKDRKRFKAPEFSKIKMPEIKRPDMSKLKELKRPEFTKFNKPDLSKFKLPEKFSTLKLKRSKSFKENEPDHDDDMSGVTPESGVATEAAAQPQKKMIDFNFGTFPRAFRKKKKPLEPQPSFVTDTATEDPSIIPSTETQPSLESSSSPQGDRGPGPVRSRWADKFSDVSYNDSEGSRYRRYGSEQESFDRESSLERRMKEDLEETGSEAATDLGILGGVADNKQFAEFDEENRAIHEISNLRAGEFKRRPMVHQDSDLRSEDSKEAVGWTDKEVQKNKLLRKAELEAEASYLKYPLEEGMRQETQSTASSGKKVVMEEIDDDEFFLRKRGVSEDNIELRQYISNAIREGYDMPINALQHVGQTSEPMEYGDYDVPPPKPRRLHRSYQPEDVSQDFESQRSEYGDDLSMSQNGSDFFGAPKRPMRKGRSRSKYSMDSQDVPMSDEHERISHEQYFDDDEEYLRPPPRGTFKDDEVSDVGMNNLDYSGKKVFPAEPDQVDDVPRPNPPRRRKRQILESSLDKDSYINGFSGRSVSNSYLQPPEDVIVYRTEHEYPIPLATPENYTDGASEASRKSRSASRYEEDDRTSRGAESLALDGHLRSGYGTEHADVQEKFVIDMMENDGYAVVRKEHIPKPTPPARRKKFTRSPGERFATMPNMRTKRSTPPPERPPPPRGYTPTTDQPEPPRRKSALSLDAPQNYEEEDDYEEPANLDHERPESPRNLQSGEIINRMKYRPLPPPPRPPREKRQRSENKGSMQDVHSEYHDENNFDDRDGGGERIATSSTADSYDQNGDFEDDPHFAEVEVSTQTDPLPDDFVCEEFEITEDMKVIEPSRPAKTLDELLREEQEAEVERSRQLTEDEQLARGLQRFRDANQRSLSERSRASSQASKSLSRPQTPSAVVIERRISTPVPNQQSETMLEAALIVRPIDDLDLEEEELRREGLLTDSSQPTSDMEKDDESKLVLSDYSHGPSSIELDKAVEGLLSQSESERETERDDEEVERTMRDYEFDDEKAERFSSHYDEDEEEQSGKEQATVESPLLETSQEVLSGEHEDKSKDVDIGDPDHESDFKEEVREDPVKYDYERKTSGDREQLVTEHIEKTELIFEEPPLPPPRRKSTTVIETVEPLLTVLEHIPLAKEVAPMQSVVGSSEPPQLPTRLGDLEVERLRVHALQAGQIMVSQLHGQQITSDELECKSGNLVVQNIELPPGFIEDIVERVRNTDRAQLLTSETQTSRQASSDMLSHEHTPSPVRELVPPPKPPRHRDLESTATRLIAPEYATEPHTIQRLRNFDEETQTDPAEAPTSLVAPPPAPPLVYATTEYLQSLGPLAFYNIRRGEEEERKLDNESAHSCRRHHHHHHHHCSSSSSEMDDTHEVDPDEPPPTRRHRTRSRSSPPEPQSVTQAGRKFISACSLSLVNIINRLTAYMRGGADKDQDGEALGLRQVPTLVVLFIAITFGLLLFLLSGRSVHTHHWDYFNPPGNEGRPS